MVSTGVFAGIIFTLFVAMGVPLLALLALVLIKRKGLLAALTGAACFVLFALVLENFLHLLVIPQLLDKPLWYGVYACLAAGVFEETGRLLGLLFLCRWRAKKDDSMATGIGYGIGHGGIEAILLVATGGIANLMFAIGVNNGTTSLLTAGMTQAQISAATQAMQTSGFWDFSVGGVERLFALALHMALSLLIWMVVTRRISIFYYPAAILLHAFANIGALLYQTRAITNIWLTEAWVAISVAAVCFFVRAIYVHAKNRALQRELIDASAQEGAPPAEEAALPAQAQTVEEAAPTQPEDGGETDPPTQPTPEDTDGTQPHTAPEEELDESTI